MFCKNCGTNIPHDNKFCPYCYNKIDINSANEPPKVEPKYTKETIGSTSQKRDIEVGVEPPKVDPKYKSEFIGNPSKKDEKIKKSIDDYINSVEVENHKAYFSNVKNSYGPTCDNGYSSASYNEINSQKVNTSKDTHGNLLAAIFIVIIATVLIGFISKLGSFLNTSRSSSKQIPAMNVTLGELFNAYNANPIAADEKYKNRNIIVTGKVLNMGTVYGSHVITFGGGLINATQLRMTFNKSNTERIARLNIGDTITVEGKFTGRQKGVLLTIFNMTSCKIR